MEKKRKKNTGRDKLGGEQRKADKKNGDDKSAEKTKVNEAPDAATGEEKQQLQGMQKWIAEYKAQRPGLAALQQQIDSFIADHEEKEEEARRAREAAAAADDGWTLVTQKKGRKKTSDASGAAVIGAVSAAAVADKAAKKPSHMHSDFYKFQKKDARRNEVVELQLKFQEDKKRIAQMRAARKFRPF